jgi:hypothetical protein
MSERSEGDWIGGDKERAKDLKREKGQKDPGKRSRVQFVLKILNSKYVGSFSSNDETSVRVALKQKSGRQSIDYIPVKIHTKFADNVIESTSRSSIGTRIHRTALSIQVH